MFYLLDETDYIKTNAGIVKYDLFEKYIQKESVMSEELMAWYHENIYANYIYLYEIHDYCDLPF